MAMARIDPYNRTGTGGVDLLSQNFNWSLGLMGLKGRGLDLGLSLSYNSLSMWTRSGSDVAYNMDQDAAAPGFRLGFPTVQGAYTNSTAGASFYLLITPSGQHVELRQVGTSSVYQAVDASYAQLTYYDNGTTTTADDYLIFRAGGSELKFYPMNDEWRCTEVKDRNGNYISVSYDSSTGNINTVTDTELARSARSLFFVRASFNSDRRVAKHPDNSLRKRTAPAVDLEVDLETMCPVFHVELRSPRR
jgi:hypothetical protein